MLLKEFVERTGFEPMPEEYAEIEEKYYQFDGGKDAFCKHFVENGGEKKVYQLRAEKIAQLKSQQVEIEKDFMATIKRMEKEIERLNAQIEREQEWKPYTDEKAVSQSDYEHLAKSGKLMSDEEAIEWVVQETGFARERINILHEVCEEEVNRHHQIRKTGKMIDRRPVYDATDWNYVLFSVRANVTSYYELYNDELRIYWN